MLSHLFIFKKMVYLLLLLLLCFIQAFNADSSFYDFKPPSLTVKDTDGQASLQLRLKKKPASNVKVVYDSTQLNFDKCELTFTPTNWQVYQTIKVYPKRLSVTDGKLPNGKTSISFVGLSNECSFPHNATYPVTRIPELPQKCTS